MALWLLVACSKAFILANFVLIEVGSQHGNYQSNSLDSFKFSSSMTNFSENSRFMLFDVNPGEGFNLRRDVYIRAANLIQSLRNDDKEDWILVLPPWRHLYHWQNRHVEQQGVAWSRFFDTGNMNLYVPVVEFTNFLRHTGSNALDHVLYIQRHPDEFKSGFKELVQFDKCQDKPVYRKDDNGNWRGYFWGMSDVYARKFSCVSAQGHATVLKQLFRNITSRSLFVDRFEGVLHIHYGDSQFFRARRSLVFAKHLREEADIFRATHLNSTDELDLTPYVDIDWRKQLPVDGSARGGNYLGLHMRRGDFTYAHRETVPSIQEVGEEVSRKLKELGIDMVYVSTDGTDAEISELKRYFSAKIFRYPRTDELVLKYLDGGIAIIDQWIVAHARYFIGTCLSTYSFRIHEERDILGFSADSTYNCICGSQSPPDRCHQPTRWRVRFD